MATSSKKLKLEETIEGYVADVKDLIFGSNSTYFFAQLQTSNEEFQDVVVFNANLRPQFVQASTNSTPIALNEVHHQRSKYVYPTKQFKHFKLSVDCHINHILTTYWIDCFSLWNSTCNYISLLSVNLVLCTYGVPNVKFSLKCNMLHFQPNVLLMNSTHFLHNQNM